ncbi:MAG: agmatinase [Acidocella sp.]|nr:agmatinase [Acidocella sp.]
MTLFEPQDAALIPRFAGLSSFFRLPVLSDPSAVDVALVGAPFDGGTTNRAGTRHGPREIRNQSSLMRRINANGISPYDKLRVADLGDSPVNPINLLDALKKIEGFFNVIAQAGALPITAGGDHLITLPILRALGHESPVGLIHFDAHSDTNDLYFGNNPYTHGSPFRRAVEEGVLDPKRAVQIGIRGSYYHESDFDFARANGFRIIAMDEVVQRGIGDVITEAREIVGDGATYVSFDIDSLDPAYAVGTGTPEIGGFTTREAQAMLRGLAGLNIIGADVVEVSPPFDPTGLTALTGATMMFELLCAIASGR